jgi:hypothetical protein
MKNPILIIAAFALIVLSNHSMAQATEKKEIRKEVKMEDKAGIKTLTIKTTENGNTVSEIYKGADAEKKMAELEKTESGSTKTMVMGKDGNKHMKIEKRTIIKKETLDNN